MSAAVSAVSNVVSGAASTVGNAVSDVGNAVVNNVVAPVATAVTNTVQAAVSDPVGTLAKVATAVVAPELLPVVNVADSVAHGQSLTNSLVNAGVSMVTAGATSCIGSDVTADTGSQIAGTAAQGTASGALGAALRGQNVVQGAVASGLNSGLNAADQQVASNANQALQSASQPDTSTFNYQTPASILGASTDQSELPSIDQIKANADAASQQANYDITGNAATPGGQGLNPEQSSSGLTAASVEGTAPNLNSMNGGQGLTMPTTTGANCSPATLSAAGVTASDAMPALGNPSSFINNPCVTGKNVIATPCCYYNVNMPNINYASLLNNNKSKLANKEALQYDFGAGCCSIPWLDTNTQMLAGYSPKCSTSSAPTGGASSPTTQSTGALASADNWAPETKQKDQSALTYEPMSMSLSLAADGGSINHYCSGSSVSSCSLWGSLGCYAPKFYNVKCSMLAGGNTQRRTAAAPAALHQIQSQIAPYGNITPLAKGGLPKEYHEAAPEGHHPEFVTGHTGYYACGAGTGQSDDIPAMLHDGDYVMDAETVSALGDGSSKAGKHVLDGFREEVPHHASTGGKVVPAKIADGEYVFPAAFVTALGRGDNKRGAEILDGLREKLRAHKRAAPLNKIPPKAKSPLDYIEQSKGKK